VRSSQIPPSAVAAIRYRSSSVPASPCQDWAETWREIELGPLPVKQVRLMRSQLGAGPPRYSTLATFPLK